MEKSGFKTLQYTKDDTIRLEGITSLTVNNYGDTDLEVIVNDVSRKVPALKPEIGVPFGSFNLPGDGTACTIEIKLQFTGGLGKALVDYRKLITAKC